MREHERNSMQRGRVRGTWYIATRDGLPHDPPHRIGLTLLAVERVKHNIHCLPLPFLATDVVHEQ
jgi:hypothetical protein